MTFSESRLAPHRTPGDPFPSDDAEVIELDRGAFAVIHPCLHDGYCTCVTFGYLDEPSCIEYQETVDMGRAACRDLIAGLQKALDECEARAERRKHAGKEQ